MHLVQYHMTHWIHCRSIIDYFLKQHSGCQKWNTSPLTNSPLHTNLVSNLPPHLYTELASHSLRQVDTSQTSRLRADNIRITILVNILRYLRRLPTACFSRYHSHLVSADRLQDLKFMVLDRKLCGILDLHWKRKTVLLFLISWSGMVQESWGFWAILRRVSKSLLLPGVRILIRCALHLVFFIFIREWEGIFK